MKINEDELVVQVESPVDFASLLHHGVDITSYWVCQGLDYYFRMLNGPTSEREEAENILIDPSLEGKSREEMVLEEFTRT